MANEAYAIGSIIAAGLVQAGALTAGSFAVTAVAFAVNMVVSAVIAKIVAPDNPQAQAQANPGNRQQLAPAGDNKLPVVYGSAYVGGIGVDISITSSNQNIYWVFALAEVTGSENGGTGDVYTFGNVYWGGKKCIFDPVDKYKVVGLFDESTGLTQDITGYMEIFLYSNGSTNPANSSFNAYDTQVMGNPDLVYTWDNTKQMVNTAFAVVHIKYSQSRNLTSLAQTRFQINNPRTNPGDCIYDYLTSERYGAAISPSQIDMDSINALNTYSSQVIRYTSYNGDVYTQARFTFNGTLDTNQKIMPNIQSMADCCDCLIRYNEITSLWGVIVQQPTYSVAMNINDSLITSAITITPLDISSTFNIVEVKFPDGSSQDNFNSTTYDLAVINPSLLYPNEPVNKQSVSLYLVNNSVQAQNLANRMLEATREDLSIQLEISYVGLELEAGDIVTVTNANYGWVNKLFRINKVTEKISSDGQVTASLNLMEFNPQVYDDINVTQFTPSPNTGISNPTIFGVVPAPSVTTAYSSIANPAFNVSVTTSSSGIIQYAEIWYSAYQYPTDAQRIFAGTTEVKANGDPYNVNTVMPTVTLFNVPAGNWYFFSRMVNSLASSNFSLASSVLQWRPTTFQFTERYLSVAYADDINGTGLSLNPRNKSYYGLYNTPSNSPSTTASDYKWYLADPAFGDNIYLCYANRSSRKFSFDTDFAGYAGGSGAFVPTTAAKFDPRLWSALEDYPAINSNIIDLDHSTGQVLQTGTTSSGTGAGQLRVTNNADGLVVASLDQFLDFGGPSTLTGSAATVTIDIYGRVVGFTTPDNFYMSIQNFVATSGQTVFTPTARNSGYIAGQDLIFQNGLLLSLSEYTETTTTFTLNTGATLNDQISVISMRAVSGAAYYEALNIIYASGTGTNTITYTQLPWQAINAGDLLTFSNSGTPTTYTVSSVDYNAQTITFTTSVTVTGTPNMYRYRAAGSSYPCFSRYSTTLSSASSYTPTTWAYRSGYELLFLNGTAVNEQDYDIVSGALTNFPATTTGTLESFNMSANNLGTPTGSVLNAVAFTVASQATYSYTYIASYFDLYANGVYLIQGSDYTTASGSYTFAVTPDNTSTVLLQQTFAGAGAA